MRERGLGYGQLGASIPLGASRLRHAEGSRAGNAKCEERLLRRAKSIIAKVESVH